jgi:uncharacterized protein YjbJ (UPF0337 family)
MPPASLYSLLGDQWNLVPDRSLIAIQRMEVAMPDEAMGTVRNSGGSAAGDARTRENGLMSQTAGAVKEAYVNTMDVAAEGAQTVKGAAVAGHDLLKKFMEENPHTTTAIALGIGLLIGYAVKRPPARRRWWD